MQIKPVIRRVLRYCGYDLVRYAPASHPEARLQHLLERAQIDLVLDVGANAGQFGQALRGLGFHGEIISFEPQQQAYRTLARKAETDGSWQAFHYGLGEKEGLAELFVSDNSYSSSLLEMLPAHWQAAPQSKVVGRESTTIRTLDGVFQTLNAQGRRVFLKIDTQGYDLHVLRGAERSLPSIQLVQVEASLVPLYAGEPLFEEILVWLQQRGYVLMALKQGFANETTGQLLQVDAVFQRRDAHHTGTQ